MKNNSTIKTNISLQEYFRRLSKWYLLLFVLLPVIFILLIFINYRIIYKVTLKNIENEAESTLMKYAMEMNDCLTPAINVLDSMSYNVEDMFRTDASNESIERYLIRETETMEDLNRINSNGIYGYIKGEYLDGAQWIPGPDFVPAERPWYKGALKNKGKISYIEPYTDMKTGDRVMSISKVLSDGESVIGIDIIMDEVQEITESLVKEEDDPSYVIILDDDGCVVAHSDPEEVDKNYLETVDEPGNTIARELLKNGKKNFRININDNSYVVYAGKLGVGWYMLSVTSERQMFSEIFKALGNSIAVGLLGTVIILWVLAVITRRRVEVEDYVIDLKSVSAIYLCMYKINLEEDSFTEISCLSQKIAAMVGGRNTGARKVMKNCATLRADERTGEELLKFTDLDTIGERLLNTETIICEFMNVDKSWSRARFIVAERKDDNTVSSVLFMVEGIDEEKKSRDRLLYLSETDRMTGINNRGSGEHKVRKQLLSGDGGMFMLLDVDKFKSINDTFGHNTGDKVLIAIADCMKKAFRNNDIVMRLGGDEFAAFAPLVLNREGGEIIVDRFLNRISKIRIDEMEGRQIEVSVGVAFYQPDDQFTFDELYKRADKSTYESKKHSGSMVTFYEAGKEGDSV